MNQAIMDGNQAAAHVAFKTNEVIAIYPITPSSPMGELSDEWASRDHRNLWGGIPLVQEMQSEGGAAGAVHGSLQAGALTTTFTASQGLLLMIPNMYKIAGELTSTVFHVAARSVAAQALSIFGDHSDVMATRATGFALLASASVQEVMDLALIAQAATLKARIPFLHFFDGFRTSHEIGSIQILTETQMRKLISSEMIAAHRSRALSPDHPAIRGTAQNPDVFFQAREAVNPYYQKTPQLVQNTMDRFAAVAERQYHLFDYFGDESAEQVLVLMGSGVETARETTEYLASRGRPAGVLAVRLYRPFSSAHFIHALPSSTRQLAVLDRTKEPGSPGEPLYLDTVAAVSETGSQEHFAEQPSIYGGRYGLSSKEFTPAMIQGIFKELDSKAPRPHFTVGIQDDVTKTSIAYDSDFCSEREDVFRAIFYGLGSDGTVSANKNSIKIIGENTDLKVQAYFVYDSKKAGSVTVSHLRFGPRLIRSEYLITKAQFVGCHQFDFLNRIDVLKCAAQNGTLLINSPYSPEETWDHLPRAVQETILEKRLKVFTIDAYKLAREAGLGGRINTIMQVGFFQLTDVLDFENAIEELKKTIHKSYGKRGEDIVRRNFLAVDQARAALREVEVPSRATSSIEMRPAVPENAPEFVQRVTSKIISGRGDELAVSALPADGTYPVSTSRWEKRNIAQEIPVWDPGVCIQCNKCVLVCPHGVIRAKVFDLDAVSTAPSMFQACPARDKEWEGMQYTLQVAPEDCTGCSLCVEVCPARNKSETRLKAINMRPQAPVLADQIENWDYFLQIPEVDRSRVKRNVRHGQFLQPLFEFSGACAGCGETPYLKLMTQLFGDRTLVANATGCSSIYGGNLPTTPWAANSEGLGPAWSNSLFEDNAEFGLGMRLALDTQQEQARSLLALLDREVGLELAEAILRANQSDEPGIFEQRKRVAQLKEKLAGLTLPEASQLLALSDTLVRKSVWIVGGDGWAYDIGFGGLDHVLASGRDVNILVLDTEVYSNTGGQMSKATPRAAVAKFAAAGKPLAKKDLGLIAMLYGTVYVASVAMGAKDEHTVKAFLEAEAFPGPSLIIAYSHCIAHGIEMSKGMENQKVAVQSGYWPLYRFDPRLLSEGKNPLSLDSRSPSLEFRDFASLENRFQMLGRLNPERSDRLFSLAQQDIRKRRALYEYLASMPADKGKEVLQ